jgi:stage III sporulation protein AE
MEEKIWEQMELGELDNLIGKLLPDAGAGFSDVAKAMLQGRFGEAAKLMREALLAAFVPGIREGRVLFLCMIALGLVSALLYYLAGLVKNRQVADMAHYFVYLFVMIMLMRSFQTMLETGEEMLDSCGDFVRLLVPAYCLSISFSTGSVSAAVNYELLLLLLTGIDYILTGLLLPMTKSYVLLAMIDGLDEKHRMKGFVKLADRILSWGVKIVLSVTLVLGGGQNLVAGKVDGVQRTVVQRAIAAIPGIGDMAESMTQVILGSAGLVRNSIGVSAMVFLFLLALRPSAQIFCISCALKVAGACVQGMGQNLLAETLARVGEGGMHLLKITLCGVLVFYIAIAMTMLTLQTG